MGRSGVIIQKLVEEGQIISSGVSNVSGGTALAEIADMSRIFIIADVDETDIGDIREGQKVTITLEALADASLEGVVSKISETFSNNQGDILYEVSIILEETHPDMRWGMTTFIEFVE